jgi:hypothetical protein
MSLKSWREEFYPTDADSAADEGELAAVNHSIKKWSGLSATALAAHGMTKLPTRTLIQEADAAILGAENAFWFDMETCALCMRTETDGEVLCDKCIVFTATGSTCDDGPYSSWHMQGNPTPMQKLLAITRDYLLGQQDKDPS